MNPAQPRTEQLYVWREHDNIMGGCGHQLAEHIQYGMREGCCHPYDVITWDGAWLPVSITADDVPSDDGTELWVVLSRTTPEGTAAEMIVSRPATK